MLNSKAGAVGVVKEVERPTGEGPRGRGAAARADGSAKGKVAAVLELRWG